MRYGLSFPPSGPYADARVLAELAREVIESRSRADTFGPDGGEK